MCVFLFLNLERKFSSIEGKTSQIHPYAAHFEVVDDEAELSVVQFNDRERANERKRKREGERESARKQTCKHKKSKINSVK